PPDSAGLHRRPVTSRRSSADRGVALFLGAARFPLSTDRPPSPPLARRARRDANGPGPTHWRGLLPRSRNHLRQRLGGAAERASQGDRRRDRRAGRMSGSSLPQESIDRHRKPERWRVFGTQRRTFDHLASRKRPWGRLPQDMKNDTHAIDVENRPNPPWAGRAAEI